MQKGNKKCYLVRGKIMAVNSNLCAKLVVPYIFTDIQRVKIRLFNKSYGVSFMYRWFIYMEQKK